MKMLFIACLMILLIVSNQGKAETSSFPTSLKEKILMSKIYEPKSFIKKLELASMTHNICPVKLFSLGISEWEELSSKQQDQMLAEFVKIAPYLN